MALLTLAEAKAALNITNNNSDADLPDYIAGAEEAVLFICGPVDEAEVTEYIQAWGNFVVAQRPVLTLTGVVGDMYGERNIEDFRVDSYSGAVTLKNGRFPLLPDTYAVTYTIGRDATPASMKQAAKIILKHQWSIQRAPGGRVTTDVTTVPGLGFAVPNAALQMLLPQDQGPALG